MEKNSVHVSVCDSVTASKFKVNCLFRMKVVVESSRSSRK
jgi:hypothetical protein